MTCFFSFDFSVDTYKSVWLCLCPVCVQESYKIIKILLFAGFHQNQTSLSFLYNQTLNSLLVKRQNNKFTNLKAVTGVWES